MSCRTDRARIITGAAWISVPYPFQWGAPTFNAGECFAMMAAAFVALVGSTGSFIDVSRYASATAVPPSIRSRGIGWQIHLDEELGGMLVFLTVQEEIEAVERSRSTLLLNIL